MKPSNSLIKEFKKLSFKLSSDDINIIFKFIKKEKEQSFKQGQFSKMEDVLDKLRLYQGFRTLEKDRNFDYIIDRLIKQLNQEIETIKEKLK